MLSEVSSMVESINSSKIEIYFLFINIMGTFEFIEFNSTTTLINIPNEKICSEKSTTYNSIHHFKIFNISSSI